MKVVIIEDELPAANRLAKLLRAMDNRIEITHRLDSVEASVKFFEAKPDVDLVFMDIQLADGLSFDIFLKVNITTPVVFTTAFDQYTLKAFKVNSVDYLLKPIDENELQQALEKHRRIFLKKQTDLSEKILKLVQDMAAVKYKERLLIKRGQQLSFLKTEDTAYCYADGKLCYAVDFNNNKFLLETNLSELEEQLPPVKFYRINRSLLINIEAVKKVYTWLGGRLKLELLLSTTQETVVSRERVNGFKEWLGQ
jgi:DNA-binding LytR/AlgR family response regulator